MYIVLDRELSKTFKTTMTIEAIKAIKTIKDIKHIKDIKDITSVLDKVKHLPNKSKFKNDYKVLFG